MSDPATPRPPLILEGLCTLTEMEGGFCPSAIEVDGQAFDVALAAHVAASWPRTEGLSRPYALKGSEVVLGRVRIAVEFLGGSV